MKLIDLLVKELPKQGGWPEKAALCIYYGGGQDVVYFWTEQNNKACQPKKMRIPSVIIYDEITKEQYEAALAASKQPAWGGEGVPEKGDLCIYRDKDEGPIETIVIASYDDGGDVVIWHKPKSGCDYSVDSLCFFEAIVNAEDNKRIRVAQSMCDILGNGITVDEKDGYGKAWLDAYDAIAAGKIPGIRLTDDPGN